MSKKIINPLEDGETHINVYSNSLTEIGKMMSNFYECKINTRDGKFMSIEAYWHWLGLDPTFSRRDKLRELSGFQSKKVGEFFIKEQGFRVSVDDFKERILDAILFKMTKNTQLLNPSLSSSYLPLEHYYNFDGRIVDIKLKHLWMINGITRIRDTLLDFDSDVLNVPF